MFQTVESTSGVPAAGVSVIQSQQASGAVASQQSAESRVEDSHESAEAGAGDKYVFFTLDMAIFLKDFFIEKSIVEEKVLLNLFWFSGLLRLPERLPPS